MDIQIGFFFLAQVYPEMARLYNSSTCVTMCGHEHHTIKNEWLLLSLSQLPATLLSSLSSSSSSSSLWLFLLSLLLDYKNVINGECIFYKIKNKLQSNKLIVKANKSPQNMCMRGGNARNEHASERETNIHHAQKNKYRHMLFSFQLYLFVFFCCKKSRFVHSSVQVFDCFWLIHKLWAGILIRYLCTVCVWWNCLQVETNELNV